MTITLPLRPQEAARLNAIAESKGVSPDQLVLEALNLVLDDSLSTQEAPKVQARSIWEVMLDNLKNIPAEEFAALPKDGASEHDHYLYRIQR